VLRSSAAFSQNGANIVIIFVFYTIYLLISKKISIKHYKE